MNLIKIANKIKKTQNQFNYFKGNGVFARKLPYEGLK